MIEDRNLQRQDRVHDGKHLAGHRERSTTRLGEETRNEIAGEERSEWVVRFSASLQGDLGARSNTSHTKQRRVDRGSSVTEWRVTKNQTYMPEL